VGSANLQECLYKLVVFRVNLLRIYKIYSSTPSTFDSLDNETGVQSTEWIYVKRHKRLDFVTLCISYFVSIARLF